MATETAYEGWAILELMSHRRLGGSVREVEMFGAKVCRIDITSSAAAGETHATQFYGGNAIYCLTPCTEETARAVAKMLHPEPVRRWELPPVRGVSDTQKIAQVTIGTSACPNRKAATVARRPRFWARSYDGEVFVNRGFGEHKTEADALAALESGINDEIEVCQVRIASCRKSLRAIRAGKVTRTWEDKRK